MKYMRKYKFTRTRSEETKKKISEALRSRAERGLYPSEYTKSLISKKMKEIWNTIPKNEEKIEDGKDGKED